MERDMDMISQGAITRRQTGMTKQEHVAASLERLLDQLTYSVDRFGGKTTINPTDLAVLRAALQLIK
jgi:hypothetical protein